MNTAKFFILFSITLGLASASPTSMLASVPRSPFAPVTRSDDDHLCSAPTGTVFEYGNQTNQDGIAADCDKLSQYIKGFADEHGNFTEMCEPGLGFQRFSSEGNCTMWFECEKTTEGLEVTMGYGDIAGVIELATNGLKSSGLSDNSSILSVRTSTYCQLLKADWIVAFNSSDWT